MLDAITTSRAATQAYVPSIAFPVLRDGLATRIAVQPTHLVPQSNPDNRGRRRPGRDTFGVAAFSAGDEVMRPAHYAYRSEEYGGAGGLDIIA